jgi:cytochrome P450
LTITLVFAGHETTAVALTWTCYLLAGHAEAVGRLQREVATVLAGRVPTVADLPHLPYTRMVIEEALRLYPLAWMLARAARTDDVLGGCPIPAHTTVLLSPYLTHRHPAIWPDPERFDPERFAPHLVAPRPPGAYFPFAAGLRVCLGASFAMLEAQLIVAQVSQAYRFDVVPGQPIVPQPQLTLRPRTGVHLLLHAPLASTSAGD